MFSFRNIDHYQSALRKGITSCTEAVSFYLKNIEERSELNAIVDVFADEAVKRAEYLDRKRKNGASLGRLHGVVVSIKDIIGYKNHNLTAASATLQNFKATYNSDAVQHLLDEEAIIIGSCNSDEFAMGTTNEHSFYGPVRNPVNEAFVPGGSSGGSASAVAADLCMVSLGTDTGGSARQPADYCGIFGFKPTFGTISSRGVIPYATSFDQIGILANGISDIETVLSAIGQVGKPLSGLMNGRYQDIDNPKSLKVGLLRVAATHMSINKEIGNTILDFCNMIGDRFEILDDIQLRLIDYLVPAYYILTTAEACHSLNRNEEYDGEEENWKIFYRKNKDAQPGKEVKKRLMLGAFVTSNTLEKDYFHQAQRVRKILVDTMERVFKAYDFVIMPTVISTAPKLGEINQADNKTYQSDIFTTLANLTGLPAISLPLFRHSNGMPFGLQVLSNRGNDANLLKFAQTLIDN